MRQLLAELALPDIAAAAAETRTGDVATGVVNLVMRSGDDGTLATAISPTLRQLFPPAPAPSARDRRQPIGAHCCARRAVRAPHAQCHSARYAPVAASARTDPRLQDRSLRHPSGSSPS
ncbi:hypothetical protein [Micromonospora sp. NBC_00617]|uniref:hypothetical protein n=1 Tax=Micromonospora sp. NBC_00617 TaxID=2903587 RepID=UPI0030E2C435